MKTYSKEKCYFRNYNLLTAIVAVYFNYGLELKGHKHMHIYMQTYVAYAQLYILLFELKIKNSVHFFIGKLFLIEK